MLHRIAVMSLVWLALIAALTAPRLFGDCVEECGERVDWHDEIRGFIQYSGESCQASSRVDPESPHGGKCKLQSKAAMISRSEECWCGEVCGMDPKPREATTCIDCVYAAMQYRFACEDE